MADTNGTLSSQPSSSAPNTSSQTANSSQPQAPTSTSSLAPLDAAAPNTSLQDLGQTPRPRDARTLHTVLASLGLTAYQERVPLQLLDFAYRYTSGVLSDAQHLSLEGYVGNGTSGAAGATGAGAKKGNAAASAEGEISLASLRLATASRNAYQFTSNGTLPKETLLEIAGERNRVRLPEVDKEIFFGVRLPHERYVQTGVNWGIPEEWDSEVEADAESGAPANSGTKSEENADMKVDGEAEDEDMEDQDDGFEQVFGNGGENGDGDGAMEEG